LRLRILLATYNYYPYNFGGSEVYVSALADYLIQHGYNVVIAAASPEEAFLEHPVIFENEHFRICQYNYNNVPVWGIKYNHLNIQHIYEKQSEDHQLGLEVFLSAQQAFDIVHINGFTATIGLDLLKACRKNNPSLKVITSYHTALSCTKGTLLYANKQQECYVRATTGNCTACIITERTNLPVSVSRLISQILPSNVSDHHSRALQLKTLVNKSVNSFNELNAFTNKWIVYSKGIQKVLESNNVPSEKIYQLKHGIADRFFEPENNMRENIVTNFLFGGRLNKIKGFHTLIKAWLELPEITDRKLLITAHPDSGDDISKKLIAQSVKRKDIIFLGPLSQENLICLYRKVHCVIIPSECFEIGPLMFHEAMASGCNVISSDIGGCRELGEYYQNEDLFFETGNASSLRAQIEKFRYKYSSRRTSLTIDAHNKAIVKQYEELFEYEH
jgi:glycosyltransferase involved in cell wall biosynthesis